MVHDPDLDTDRSAQVFERVYAAPGTGFDRIPWARLAPRAELTHWLDAHAELTATTALVVGCGLGDDAEELARRGWAVTAFDVAPSAVALCRKRFPGSPVDYRVGDVFELSWAAGAFDLVVEIFTIQSIDPDTRSAAITEIGSAVAPGGLLFWYCLGREDDELVAERPWAISRAELEPLTAGALVCDSFTDETIPERGWRGFLIQYHRPS